MIGKNYQNSHKRRSIRPFIWWR